MPPIDIHNVAALLVIAALLAAGWRSLDGWAFLAAPWPWWKLLSLLVVILLLVLLLAGVI